MPEPFKNIFSVSMVKELSRRIRPLDSGFDAGAFTKFALDGFDKLELKERVTRIALALGRGLSGDFRTNTKTLLQVKDKFPDLKGLVFPEYVAIFGLKNKYFDFSMDALSLFTIGSSSEFGVRPFIELNQDRALKIMASWVKSESVDQRRLASEGSRPRLPWGGALRQLIDDPKPLFKILKPLLKDPSLYVRKSVANSLNDISKDHPDLALGFMEQHIGKNPLTDWILRRGARTLIKQSNPEALKLFGYLRAKSPEYLCLFCVLKLFQERGESGSKFQLVYDMKFDFGLQGLVRLECEVDYALTSIRWTKKKIFIKESKVSGLEELEGKKTLNFGSLKNYGGGPIRVRVLMNGMELGRFLIEINGYQDSLTVGF
jgi:3-methyladenine DNA glycosylase AlkC